MDKYNFSPWVGSKYFTEGFNGRKILVLGESHHCDELLEGGRCFPLCTMAKSDCHRFTIDVISWFVNNYNGDKSDQTFLCFERAVVGKELTKTERENFWNSVVFYNYIQVPLSEPREKPKAELYRQSTNQFCELLKEYMPDFIIVWGSRLFNYIPELTGKHSILAISETDKTDVWTYNICGKDIPAIKVHHPSSSTGKAWNYWHKYYVKFLGL